MISHPRRRIAAALFAIATVASACSRDNPSAPPSLQAIVVTAPDSTIDVGQTVIATATGVDQYGAPMALKDIKWSSNPASVATVDAAGVVTAIKAGGVTVTAKSSGKTGELQLTISNAPPALATITVNVSAPTITLGQTITATATGVDQYGAAFPLGGITWSTSPAEKASVDANGLVTALEAGTAQVTATVGGTSGQAAVTITNPPAVVVNEIESNGGDPGDWVEIFNPTSTTADLSGWVVKDNDNSHAQTLGAGTTIAAGGYLIVLTEAGDHGFGLGAPDSVRLYNPFGFEVDKWGWSSHAPTTLGRCPNGSGTFVNTTSPTKGAANNCGVGPVTAAPWPGGDDVSTVDGNAVFGGNMSGLAYEALAPNVIWAAKNGAGTLHRLVFDGSIWSPDATNGWNAGKVLHYPDGTGDPDAEGVTISSGGSSTGLYISTERNNAANGTSRNAILRFDPSQPGTSLNATNDWNLTADLPATGANLGIEGVTFVPDAYLTANGFFDEHAGHAYNPAEYSNHAGGLFFVSVEANGGIYAYALDHASNTFTRIASITTTFTSGVMDLHFDRELDYLFAICDDTCGGLTSTWEIDTNAASATRGKFTMTHLFNRPSTMPNFNNEGFTIAPLAACVGGLRPVFWADDTEDGGHAIRRASLPCTRFP